VNSTGSANNANTNPNSASVDKYSENKAERKKRQKLEAAGRSV